MYRYWLVFAALWGFVISAQADIYKWVDPNGVVHYSDVPGSPNAVQVQISADQVVPVSSPNSSASVPPPSMPTVPAAVPSPSTPSAAPPVSAAPGVAPAPVAAAPTTAPAQQPYTTVKITEPTPEYTYVNNESGNIVIKVALIPKLQQGNLVQLLLDGSPAGKPQATTDLKVENIDRGEHTVQVQVLDAGGSVVASSNTVKFYLQRIRILNNSSSNADPSLRASNEIKTNPLTSEFLHQNNAGIANQNSTANLAG